MIASGKESQYLKNKENTSEMTQWVKALGVFSLMIWVSFPRSTWKKARTDSHVLCSHPYTNAMELAQPHTYTQMNNFKIKKN